MTLPYQCLVSSTRASGESYEWILFGTAGPRLVAQSSTGASSAWTVEVAELPEASREDAPDGPPGKKIKLSPSTEPKLNFSILKSTEDSKYVVAVTAEDKCIRVFGVDAKLQLQPLSQRCMVRRPCSIALTADEKTILCADKFGDVYSLPLLPSPEDELSVVAENKEEHKKFVPSASLLTVHSGRNRKTLEEQLKHAEKGPKQTKDFIKFTHSLLLGHVSMLTDIISATVGSRSYILTADRDEHIRISRGIPQAHIIEGFCQGHEEFINRLCLLRSGHLVSGGGDPYLCIWDWRLQRLLEKVPLRDVVASYYHNDTELSSLGSTKGKFNIAVIGIWSVPNSEPEVDEILVACEGVPALISFSLGSRLRAGIVLPLEGNVLDLAFVYANRGGAGPVAAVSVDHVHKRGSTSELRSEQGAQRLQCLSRQSSGEWHDDTAMAQSLDWFDSSAGTEGLGGTVDYQALGEVLYGTEKLRKRPGAEE